ncbi:MAG: SDR family oxidoreductase [Thiohalobacterales bacterium]|nr:SDR family oxidoreductase [Thiohalobacterales bacterium]
MRDWQPAADLLAERIVLITGAANGIGLALSQAMAAHGATVVMLDKDVHGLEHAYDDIVAAGHSEPALYPMDLQGAVPDDYAALAETLDREFGRLDGLVHNAAHLGALVPLANYDHGLWLQTLQVNLHAPYLLTTACLGLLAASRDASIVFTGDAVGRRGKAYWGAYAVSKAGLENLMQVLADELESNTSIRVNSIDPGPVLTAMYRIAYPGIDSASLPGPADVVKPFVYLCSNEARGITGRQLSVAELLA